MHLMDCGFDIIYGYTQSDEISLLCNLDIDVFGRKIRKFISVLSSEASSKFTLLLNDLASFDCRISTIPNVEGVIDYFRWRMQDASRNCINSYCYYRLIREGKTPRAAASVLNKRSVSWKNEFLFERGVNFDKLPTWQKRGIGIHRERYSKIGYNPKTKENPIVHRKRLFTNEGLHMGEDYANFVKYLIRDGFTISKTK
jgi:tRNA(His) 5'-end guanylyltransferase